MTTPPSPRRASRRPLIALAAIGAVAAWAAIDLQRRYELHRIGADTPTSRTVDFDITVVDAITDRPIHGASVTLDFFTEDIDRKTPSRPAFTDAGGRVHLSGTFPATTFRRPGGSVVGRVLFRGYDPELPGEGAPQLHSGASGYERKFVDFDAEFPGGIAFEDTSVQTLTIRLSPLSPPTSTP
jgi:hypothetical protein